VNGFQKVAECMFCHFFVFKQVPYFISLLIPIKDLAISNKSNTFFSHGKNQHEKTVIFASFS